MGGGWYSTLPATEKRAQRGSEGIRADSIEYLLMMGLHNRPIFLKPTPNRIYNADLRKARTLTLLTLSVKNVNNAFKIWSIQIFCLPLQQKKKNQKPLPL